MTNTSAREPHLEAAPFSCSAALSTLMHRSGTKAPRMRTRPPSVRRAASPAPGQFAAPTRTPVSKAKPKRGGKSPKTYLADTNHDGHTSRSEAHAANLTVSAEDINDDGRVTRSESKLSKSNVYRRRLA